VVYFTDDVFSKSHTNIESGFGVYTSITHAILVSKRRSVVEGMQMNIIYASNFFLNRWKNSSYSLTVEKCTIYLAIQQIEYNA
jgi:hypothetical protein